MNKYKDIIDLKHYEPKNHPRMSIYDRSCQFAPFAALTGYDDKIIDANIQNDNKKIIDDEIINNINNELVYIKNNIKNNIEVYITYYQEKNNHSKYISENKIVKKLDFINNTMTFSDNTRINLYDIVQIKIKTFISNN